MTKKISTTRNEFKKLNDKHINKCINIYLLFLIFISFIVPLSNTLKILYNKYINTPLSELYAEGVNISVSYNISVYSNNFHKIKMKYSSKLTNCSYMFYDLSYITEIYLSKFDFSSVTTTKKMFSLYANDGIYKIS